MGGFAFCPMLYWDKKQSRLTSLEDFSINSIIQSHTVSFVLFVTQRSFPGHPSSKLLLQAADAIRGALVKEECLVKEEQTHGHDAVPVAEAVEVEPSEHQKLYPDEQPDYPFAVEVDSADTTPAHSPSYKNTNGDVSLSQMMEESPQSKSRVLDAPTAEKGPEEEIPKIPKQHDSLESLQQVDEVQAAAPSPATASLHQIQSPPELLEAGKGATIGKGRGVKRTETQESFQYMVQSNPPPILSERAIDSRLRRVFKVRADGTTLVDQQWCQQWADKEARVKLLEMFEKVGYNADRVAKKSVIVGLFFCWSVLTAHPKPNKNVSCFF